MKLKLLTLLLVFAQVAFAQRTVKGLVSEAGSKAPIVGAAVVVKGTTIGTVTDVNGAFSLDVPKDATTLMVSFVGFAEQEVSIANGATSLNIALVEGAALGEVVVTALGIEGKKSQLSYATQRLDNKEINQARVGDVAQQLAGRVPGLNIGTNSSSGVASSRIVLRGGDFAQYQPQSTAYRRGRCCCF